VTVRGQPPERVRNQLLRAVDWRFLLATPDVPELVQSGRGRWAEALPLIADRVVPLEGARASGAPLVVLRDPTRSQLRAAVRALAPGGACVCEWSRHGPAGPAVARRRLRAAGLAPVSMHWPWPWREGVPPFYWLPVGASAAIDWFRRSRVPGTGLRGLPRRGAASAWEAARAAGLLRPLYTVSARAGDPARPWFTGLNGATAPWAASDDLSWVLLTGGRRSINKVVALGVGRADWVPRIAVKFSRVAEADAGLRREADVLAAMPAAAAGRVPRLVFREDVGGRMTLGQSFESGVPLMHALGPATHRARALAVTDLLLSLCSRARRHGPGWRRRLVERPLDELVERYGAAADAAAVAETRARLDALEGLPCVVEQRDCSPWNVLRRADGSLVMLDWESAEPAGLPALDLAYYLTFAGLAVAGAMDSGTVAAYRAIRDPLHPIGAVTRECEDRYMGALGLPRELLHPLRLLAWIVHSRAEWDRLRADAGGEPARATMTDALFLGLWREELRIGGDA
jgi:hypothetical protein